MVNVRDEGSDRNPDADARDESSSANTVVYLSARQRSLPAVAAGLSAPGDWQDLLDRAHAAERERGQLIDAVLQQHRDEHTEPVRWCTKTCRLADGLLHPPLTA